MCSIQVLCKESSLAQEILSQWPPQKFEKSFDLFYEEQIPNVAVYLVEGEVIFYFAGQARKLEAPVLVGAYELNNAETSDCRVQLCQGAKACIFDRVSLSQYLGVNDALQKLLVS